MAVLLSVVIPCRDGEDVLGRQLAALAAQTSHEFEIVVADNGSTDRSADLVRSFAAAAPVDVRVVDASAVAGINHARNVGARAAAGEAILLCDADDEVSPHWVEAMATAFAAGVDCVGGVVERVGSGGRVVAVDPGLYEIYWPGRPWPIGANCGFRRTVFERLGGFDESFRGGGDEADFFFRASLHGYRLVAVPAARVKYALRLRPSEIWHQHVGYGRGATRLFAKFKDVGMPREALWRWPLVIGKSVLLLASTDRDARLRGVGALAQRYGRLRQSVSGRCLYW